MPKQKIVQLTLPADLSYSAIVRQLAESFFEMHRFNHVWCHRLKLVVDELFMNAVKYGSSPDTGVVHLELTEDDAGMTFTIQDHGGGAQAISASELKALMQKNTENQDVARTSGRGLAIITHLWTDRLDIGDSEYGGVKVSFLKKKDKEALQPPPPKIAITPVSVPAAIPVSKPAALAAAGQRPAYRIQLQGEVDQYTIQEKSRAIEQTIAQLPDHSELALDFKDVTYVNSVFIGHVAAWFNQLNARDIRLKLAHASPEIKDIFDLVGLSQVIGID